MNEFKLKIMNNVFVYCEIEGTLVQEVSQELLTKGRKLANELKVELHAVVAGTGIKGKVEDQILPYGVDKLFVFDAKDLFPYTSAPHTATDLSDGCYRHRSRPRSPCVVIADLWSDC